MALFKLERYKLIAEANGMWTQLSLGQEINLHCKMKPGQCTTILFAYFGSFRVVLINAKKQVQGATGQKNKKVCSKYSFKITIYL